MLADRQALVVAVALGADTEIPQVDVEISAFNERLFSEAEAADPRRRRLLAALGVA